MTVIPLAFIRNFNPCREDYTLLERLFPDGVPLTEESANVCVENNLDHGWTAAVLLQHYPILYTQCKVEANAAYEDYLPVKYATATKWQRCECTFDEMRQERASAYRLMNQRRWTVLLKCLQQIPQSYYDTCTGPRWPRE